MSDKIEKLERRAAELKEAKDELTKRVGAFGWTNEIFSRSRKTFNLPSGLEEKIPDDIKEKIVQAVARYVFQYVGQTLAMEGMDHDLMDRAGETMVTAMLGNDIYEKVINKIE